jgi:predicted dehydrogenase
MNPIAERSMQVWSSDGFVSADFQSRKVTAWKPASALAARPSMVHDIVMATPNPLTLKDEVFTKWITPEHTQASADDALTAELTDFVHCIRTGNAPRVTAHDAVAAMEVADRVLAGMAKWSWQQNSMLGDMRLPEAA